MAFQNASGANSLNSAQGLGKQRVVIVRPVVKAGSISRDADDQAQAPVLHVAIDSSLRITRAFIIKGLYRRHPTPPPDAMADGFTSSHHSVGFCSNSKVLLRPWKFYQRMS
jgi:hypothetical protein